jgi:GMP synthase (glutamine-hydrolysing)
VPLSPPRFLVLTTGDPAPPVEAERGPYARMIADVLEEPRSEPVASIDARRPEVSLPPPDELGALIITGSSANVPDREPWILRAEAWLRDVVGAGVPTFGICFGHQILAQALGGEVQTNPRGREIGSVTVRRLTDDPLFQGVEPTFIANETHIDTVVRPPPGAVVLARSDQDEHQALRFTPSCYGVQFHPEITGPIMNQYLEARRAILEAEGLDVDLLKRAATDAPGPIRALRNFMRRIAPRARAR